MKSIGFDFGSVYTKAVVLDDDGRVVRSLYRKKTSADLPLLEDFVNDCFAGNPHARIHAGITVLAESQFEPGGGCTPNPLVALCAGVRALGGSARAVIEVGGQTSKFLLLDQAGAIRDFATNEACAAGTGSFLEQQAKRLELTIDGLSELSLRAKSAAAVAGRCSVFAKSDMIHLQQKGTPVEEIAYGLCMAICRNALTTLLKGRDPVGSMMLAGGCALNAGVVRAFREVLAADIVVSPHPGLETAIGAACEARGSAELSSAGEIRERLRSIFSGSARRQVAGPALARPSDAVHPVEPASVHESAAEAFLGVDAGSVSTDLVLLDGAGEILSSVYLPTRGRPIDVLLEGVAELRGRFPGGLHIRGCGATGSGRYLAGSLLGADVVKNEITCQALGAKRFFADVDTILEIGGQDSKFISLKNCAIADFAMNKICAAGTGSFLEEQARELGIRIERDFAARAFAATAPMELGTRCTVFIETEVVSALRSGAAVEDICGGLAYSIVKNYLEKVVGARPLGRTIVFQGGVASNDAVVAAFETVIGRKIHVHPYNRISGAIGAALAAAETCRNVSASRFRLIERDEKPELRSFECKRCSNRCDVNMLVVEGRRAFFGDTCERYTSHAEAKPTAGLPPNLADEYIARCEAAFEDEGGQGLTIGIPRASTLVGALPFWAAFFKALGHRPVLSAPSSDETLRVGLRHLSVGVCLPIKLTAGHVHSLAARGVDLVFVPAIVLLPGDDPKHSYSCPYAMAVPFIIGAKRDHRFLTPVVSFADEEAFVSSFESWRSVLRATRLQIREAWRLAMVAQEELDAEFRDYAKNLIERGAYRRIFAVLGKPYNTLDGHLNLSLFERLRRLGVLAIPQKFLPLDCTGVTSELPWRLSADIEIAASAVAQTRHIHPLFVSNFGCGPDAFTFKRIEAAIADRPHLILEFDEHRGEAGLITRIEAFLDQLGSAEALPKARRASRPDDAEMMPPSGATVRIPYFADHAHAFCGLLRLGGCDARVLSPPTPRIRRLGEKHSGGKECHAYAMIAGDLLELSHDVDGHPVTFFFPGTSLPCLLHEYGRGMRALLREIGIANVSVCSPSGPEMFEAFGMDALERFYLGLLSIELLVKAVCEIRPYELSKGLTDAVHRENLIRIEDAIAEGSVLEALDGALARLSAIPIARNGGRPVVGMTGDVYTKSNFVANNDLVRWLEERGLEVWPSPFQIDLVDFGISRKLNQSIANLDVRGLLLHGSLAVDRAIQQWRVRRVVGNRVARSGEPDYDEMKTLTAPYMPNEAHELLFINVAKIVDFARHSADGIVNAICFNCMVGNASAAITEKIRRDYNDVPIITAVYSGGEDPSRRMVLEAFVGQVKAHHERMMATSR